MKWIKASERLPEKRGRYFIKYKNYKGEQISASLFDGSIFPHHQSEIIWLDETEDNQDELWNEVEAIVLHAGVPLDVLKSNFQITKK